jgi:LPS O-antigen subunit length determinant protein (WzzB/FepE family)
MQNKNEVSALYESQEDEISLVDVVYFFKNNGKLILSAMFIASLIGGAYALLSPPKYLAMAMVSMTTVGNVTTTTTTTPITTPVETPAVLVENMKLPLYYTEANYKACLVDQKEEPGKALAEALKASINKNSPVVSFSYKSISAEAAKGCLESILQTIQDNQAILAQPMLFYNKQVISSYQDRLLELKTTDEQYISTKKNQLATLKAKLIAAEKFHSKLSPDQLPLDFKDDKFSASALLISLITAKDNEIKDLKYEIEDVELFLANPQTPNANNINELSNKIAVLKVASIEPLTRKAALVAPIFVPHKKDNINSALIVLMAALLGSFIGVLYALLKAMWLKLKRES